MFKITLRAARVSRGYNAKQMAILCSIPVTVYEAYEKNSGIIPKWIAVKLKKILGIPLEIIYIGNEKDCYKRNRNKKIS